MISVYSYGSDGHLQSVSIPGQGTVSYQYNSKGLNDRITLPGGIARIMEYDSFGWLQSNRVEDTLGDSILEQGYQRNKVGALKEKQTGYGTWNYGYDLTDQLTNAVLSADSAPLRETSYAYDAMGNRSQASGIRSQGTGIETQKTDYAANSLNQYTSISNSMLPAPSSLLYDLNGNLTNDGVRAYSWDTQNQLIKVEPLISANGSLMVKFAYDFMGRRIQKAVYTRVADTWSLTADHWFFYDGWLLVRELELNPQSEIVNQKSHVWGNDLSGTLQGAGGVGGLLSSTFNASTNSTPLTVYYLYDHNGNVEKIIRPGGTVVAEFQYDAFGNLLTTEGTEAQSFAFRFSTKYFDAEVGLYYYGFRYYSPELGRWLSRDPLGERGGRNIYAFIGNNGVNFVDYLGLVSCDELRKALLMAQLANAPYPGQSLPDDRWKQIDEWASRSGLYAALYEGPNGEHVLSFRGTEDFKDWALGNIQSLIGPLAPQYLDALFNIRGDQLLEKYPNLEVAAHSLGAGIGSVWGAKYEVPVYAYNAAGVHPATIAVYLVKFWKMNQYVHSYSSNMDILTFGQEKLFPGLPDAIGNKTQLDADVSLWDFIDPIWDAIDDEGNFSPGRL